MMKKYLNIVLGIGVSLFFIYMVSKKVDFVEVLGHLKNLKYIWIVWFILLSMVNFSLRGYRWHVLALDAEKGFKKIFGFIKIFSIGVMLNNILPLRMGDLVRAYLMGKKNNFRKSYSLGTVLIERAFDVLSLLILLSLFFLVVKHIEVSTFLKFLSTMGLLIGFAGFVLIMFFSRYKNKLLEKINSFHDISFLKKIINSVNSLMEGFSVLNHNQHVLRVICISLILWFFEALTFYFIGQAFGINLGVTFFVFVMISVCLSTLIPSGPGYIGVFEGACVAAFALFGMDKELALAYAVVLHALQILFVTVVGVIFSIQEGFSLNEFLERKE